MNLRFFALIFFCLVFSRSVSAIDPAYEGINGIRAKVFATNCLFCHSSELSGSARNGAPSNVNWDTYGAALEKADRAIVRAVEQMTMPPVFSGLPTLNQEQKEAMLAWEQLGFPRYPTQATFDFSTLILTLPVVIVGESSYRAELRLTEPEGSGRGYGFALESAEATTDTSATAATYDPLTESVDIPEVELQNVNTPFNKVTAQMRLIPGTTLQFELTSVAYID